MCRKNQNASLGDFIKFLDENCAFFPKPVNDISVMDDLVADINRFSKAGQCAFHGFDSAFDARTKATWLGQNDFHESTIGKQKWQICRFCTAG